MFSLRLTSACSLFTGVAVGHGTLVAVGAGVYAVNTARGVSANVRVLAGAGVGAGLGVLGVARDSPGSSGIPEVAGEIGLTSDRAPQWTRGRPSQPRSKSNDTNVNITR